jgi:hypothetical protein
VPESSTVGTTASVGKLIQRSAVTGLMYVDVARGGASQASCKPASTICTVTSGGVGEHSWTRISGPPGWHSFTAARAAGHAPRTTSDTQASERRSGLQRNMATSGAERGLRPRSARGTNETTTQELTVNRRDPTGNAAT